MTALAKPYPHLSLEIPLGYTHSPFISSIYSLSHPPCSIAHHPHSLINHGLCSLVPNSVSLYESLSVHVSSLQSEIKLIKSQLHSH